MADVLDYLAWRGDLTLIERPFNDVDNLILTMLSYLDFSGIVPGPVEGFVMLGDACLTLLEDTGGDVMQRVRSLVQFSPEFFDALAKTRRFRHLQLHDYVEAFDPDRALQFGALQIDVTPHETYVSFRGTDNTLAGWREDFKLGFTVTDAQTEAVSYLERALIYASERGRRVYVGGHSKGGNLAVYATMSCPLELTDSIDLVWSNDGPGLAYEIMPYSPAAVLGERYRRIVPAYDMVGIIFEREDDPVFVTKSTATGALQHDPFSWQVTPFGFEEAPGLLPESLLMRSAFADWVNSIPLGGRADFVDQLFDALGAGGAQTLDELAGSSRNRSAALGAMGDLDEYTRELLRKLVEILFVKTMGAAANAAQEAAQSALSAARDFVSELTRWADSPSDSPQGIGRGRKGEKMGKLPEMTLGTNAEEPSSALPDALQ